MKPEVVEGVHSLLTRRAAEIDRLEIGWFGGEPLLAKTTILAVGHHAARLSNTHGFDYAASISTNGYFLDLSTCEALRRAGVSSVHISLDGPPPQHDQLRLRADGAGTFERIWTNLVALHRSRIELDIRIRVHISPDTLDSMPILIDLIKSSVGKDPRFSVYFHPILRLGGQNDSSTAVFEEERGHQIANQLSRLIGEPAQTASPDAEPYVCYAAKPNSLSIRADGRVAKCTVALQDPRNCVGTLRADGTLELDQSKLRYWFRGWASLDEGTLACPLRTDQAT